MKSSSLRQVIVAITIAVSAAVAHGAWFATTDATSEGAQIASVRLSHWDHYQQKWLSTIVVNGETLRNSEGAIVELRPMAAGEEATLSGVNHDVLDANALASLGIPQPTPDNTVLSGSAVPAPVANGTAVYVRLKVSTLSNNPQPPNGHVGPWSGPTDPTIADLSATDVGGSVGIHAVTLSTDSDAVTFTWDIGRWAKGDVFLGLNEASYKVIDRDGNFKRFVATADYLDSRLNDYTLTTGCATNWKTGEVFATNFGEGLPAINVITRHPDASLDPAVLYSPASRRFSTKVTRPDQPDNYYGVDQSPESIVFDGDLNMYVGNSFGSFSPAPAAWANDPSKKFEDETYGAEYTTDVKGLPLEGWIDGEQWGWVVDENGVRVLLAPQGSGGPYRERIYGVEVSARMNYNAGQIVTAPALNPLGLPDWPASLPTGYWSDPQTGLPMVTAAAPTTAIPYRWSMGKRLHRYNNTDSLGVYSDADRNAFWTFTGRQGTDWIDLDVTGEVMYYTSEDSFIHRYNVVDGVQLPDVGAALPSQGKLLEGDNRFHGLRILPPGDGTGGFLVATRLKIARFNREGALVQEYAIHDDPYLRSLGPDGGRVAWWYTLEVDPGGRTFWASAHDTGWVYQFDIASGRELKRLEAINYRANGHMDGGRRVEGICVMWEYTAPQEICFKADGSPDGVDDDLDGFIDENCHRIEICSALSPGDDDGDNLPNQYDADCSAEQPPVAIDDAYRMRQKEFTPVTTLTVPASDGVLKRGDDDHDRDTDSTLNVVAGGTTEALLDPLSTTAITTTKGGSVVLQADGSFVYTPLAEFHGVDTFAYRITDGYPSNGPARDIPTEIDQDDIATVTIIVEPKVGNDGVYQVMVGETVSRGATGADALLTNDAQFPAASSAGPVTVLAAWDPLAEGRTELVSGTRTFLTDSANRVTVNADGSFSFDAINLAFSGVDTFSYDVHDTVSRSWNVATVSVNVTRPVITVTVPDQIKTYDGAPLPTTCTVTSSRGPGPHAYTLTYAGTVRGGASYGPTATAPTSAGTYTATCTHTDTVLGPQTDTGSIVINPVPLTVTAADTSRPYLAPNPAVTHVIAGFVNNETEAVLSGSTTCSTSVAQSANVGTYPDANTCSQTLSATNYTVNYVPGDLRITGFVLTVTASSTEKFYGDPNPEVTYSITGYQGDDDESVINGTTTCGTAGGPNAGTYATANSCTQTLSAANYSFVYVPGSLLIKKVPLTVTAATTSKVYGEPTPSVARTITGFRNGDDAADLGGSSVCSTSASAGPNVGSYTGANTCTQNLTSMNYDFSYVPGNFSITPRPLVAKANDKTIVLGNPLPALDGTLTGGVVAGDVINVTYASTNSGTAAGVFPGVLIPTVTAGGATLLSNYTITEIPGTLTVRSVAPCSGNDGYLTYSQGGWGSKPSGNNPGAFLAANFARVYPNGFARIGGTFSATFTSAAAIAAFLPQGGSSSVFTSNLTNPTSSPAGNFAAQLLAMQLAADFSRAGVTKAGLGSLTMLSGPLAGMTVDEILAMSNRVIGGDLSALPSGLSISSLSGILESLNMNFHEGTVNEGLLSCGGTPPCSATQLAFTGSSSVSGTAGNIRTFSAGGVSVKASAFSRVKGTNGTWAAAYLGVWNEGLGVTDTSEAGSNATHKVDNSSRLNYVLFEFSKPVIVSQAFLDSVSGDSDATIWVGTKTDPFNNHLTLNDALLTSLGAAQSSSGGSSDRWAEFNADGLSGNVVVIAADVSGSNDLFKISKLQLECGAVTPDPVAPTIAATGGTFVYSGAARTGTCTVSGANGLPLSGTLSYAPGSSAPSQVGSYTVTCAFAGDASYLPATAAATLTITPAPLTVVANDKTKVQGTANPSLDGTLTGVVGGDAITASYSTTAGTSSPAGSYPITVTLADPGNKLGNYSVTKTNGTLTVTPATPPCSARTFVFTGNSSTSGSAGNVLTYTVSGASVKASAHSRLKSGNTWANAYLGVWSEGLGVTDGSEGSGANNTHKVDNGGDRQNYILLRFSESMVFTKAYLDSIGADSDAQIWVGTVQNAYTGGVSMNDSRLSGLQRFDSSGSSSERWASFNGANLSGNVVIIAASTDGSTNDAFKVSKVQSSCSGS